MSKRVARAFCAHRFAFCETTVPNGLDGSPQNAANCGALPVFALYPIERFLARFEGAFELARFHRFQDFPKSWARFHSQRDQIVPRNQGWRNDRLVCELFLFALKKFVIVEHGMTARAIDPMQFQFLFESGT